MPMLMLIHRVSHDRYHAYAIHHATASNGHLWDKPATGTTASLRHRVPLVTSPHKYTRIHPANVLLPLAELI